MSGNEGRGRMMVQRGSDGSGRWDGPDVPDSVDVLDGVADLLAQLLLVKLHLQQQKQERPLNENILS